jgi:tetratricopeptide (TPR) repeat protein
MVDLFRRHAEPLALILEDLQWSQESLAPLRQLTRHARTLPLMILANFRDDERPTLPDDLPDMTLLPLKRLSEVEIAALSQSMLGEGGAQESVVYLLQRETEGNVFFLVEVVRALAEASGGLERVGDMTLPAHVFAGGVQRVIQRRLDKVPMWGQSLLRMVALAGRQLDVTVLKQVLDTHPDLLGDHPLDEFLSACDEAAVLEVLDNTWRFAHDKLREALLRNIPPDIRPGLHRQLAEAIERSYPDDKARYSTLFDHWYEAQEIDKSASYARLAAEALMGVSAYRDALAILEKALAMLPPESPMPERMWLLKWQGTAFDVFGNYPRALQCYDDSLTLAQQAQDRACLIEGLIGSSLTLHTRGELAVARQRLEQALATAEELGNQRLISRALMGLGSFYRDGNPSLSRDYSLRAMRICQDINDVQGVAGCHFGVGVTVGTLGDIEGSMKHLETALAIYKQIGDRRGMLSCLNTMANSMGANDRDASVAMRLETLQIARDIGDRLHIAIVLNNLANQYMDAGRYRESAAAQQEALDIYTDLKALVSTGAISANIALSYHELGEFAAALHFAERALEILLPLDGRRFTAFAHYMLAMIYRKYGRLADAWHEGQKGLTLAREVGEAYSVGVNQMELSEIETERGNLDAAETYGGEALALFAQGDVSIDLIMMWTHMGRLRHMQGKWEEARTFYQKGLNLARSLLNTINVATNLAGLADLEMDDQRWEDARAMLAEGLALTAEIDTKHITMRLLAGTARWFIQQGNAERAAELYSFILQHPSAERFTIEAHVRPLYAVLQARLTPEALYEATQRGAAMSLESVMPQVRADLGAAPQP